MKNYTIQPSGRYKSMKGTTISASSPLVALKQYLKINGIDYTSIVKMTTKELGKYYDAGYTPLQVVVAFVDFIVASDIITPSAGAMYRLE